MFPCQSCRTGGSIGTALHTFRFWRSRITMTDRAAWRPDWIVPPGELLVDALADRGMTQAELARRTGRPIKTINEIARGKAAIHPDTALQLEMVLGIPASYWLNL